MKTVRYWLQCERNTNPRISNFIIGKKYELDLDTVSIKDEYGYGCSVGMSKEILLATEYEGKPRHMTVRVSGFVFSIHQHEVEIDDNKVVGSQGKSAETFTEDVGGLRYVV